MIPGTESLRLATNGITLHALVAGPAEGSLVILLHGFPEFCEAWQGQIGPLATAGLRVLAPDLRGYNLSEKPVGIASYTLDTLAADVLGLADALGRARFAVVGHDWGGVLAWHLAARCPERVERAAILNAPHPATLRRYALAHPGQVARSSYIGFFQMPVLPEWMLGAADFAMLRQSLLCTSRAGAFSAGMLARYREAWARPGALTAMLNWYRALRLSAGAPSAGRIRIPLRVIWGERDPFLERGLAAAGLALCAHGEALRLPEATHWLHHEEPARIGRMLVAFLAR